MKSSLLSAQFALLLQGFMTNFSIFKFVFVIATTKTYYTNTKLKHTVFKTYRGLWRVLLKEWLHPEIFFFLGLYTWLHIVLLAYDIHTVDFFPNKTYFVCKISFFSQIYLFLLIRIWGFSSAPNPAFSMKFVGHRLMNQQILPPTTGKQFMLWEFIIFKPVQNVCTQSKVKMIYNI